MTLRLGERLLFGVAIMIALTGCTQEASPEPPPPTATTTLPPTVPPPISRPLDAIRYAVKESICELLTTEQAAKLGFPANSPDPGATSSGALFTCSRWHSPELDQPKLEYSLWMSHNVLEERYPPEPTEYDFMTLTIRGQPAVRMRSSHTGPPRQCLLVLGLAEKQGVEIQAFDQAEGKACELVAAVAENMVRNLGG